MIFFFLDLQLDDADGAERDLLRAHAVLAPVEEAEVVDLLRMLRRGKARQAAASAAGEDWQATSDSDSDDATVQVGREE